MYPSKNPYRPIRTEVLGVIEETPAIKTLRLKPEEAISFETGQFVELTVPGVGESPFTPSSKPSELPPWGQKSQPCHGHLNKPFSMDPSPNGPP